MTSERSVALAGPDVRATGVTFRVADPDDRFAGVRLVQDVRVPGDRLEFAHVGSGRELERADALHAQGYPLGFVELPDVPNYVAWRDAFDPHLTGLLGEVWG